LVFAACQRYSTLGYPPLNYSIEMLQTLLQEVFTSYKFGT